MSKITITYMQSKTTIFQYQTALIIIIVPFHNNKFIVLPRQIQND